MKIDGKSTKSKFEVNTIKDLRSKGIKFKYEAMKLKFQPKACTYTPDIILENGIVVELKGYFRASDRQKLLLVIEQHPEIDLRMVFMNSKTKIHKNSSTTYGDWCSKHSIKYSDREIPKDWLN